MKISTFTSRIQKSMFAISAFIFFSQTVNATPQVNSHPCSGHAIQRAEKLLLLQSESELPASVSKTVSVLKPLRNPANPRQRFDVLAMTGYVYKAEYRMRFLYAQIPGQCVLVGQEILEFTSL